LLLLGVFLIKANDLAMNLFAGLLKATLQRFVYAVFNWAVFSKFTIGVIQ